MNGMEGYTKNGRRIGEEKKKRGWNGKRGEGCVYGLGEGWGGRWLGSNWSVLGRRVFVVHESSRCKQYLTGKGMVPISDRLARTVIAEEPKKH
jgi:hypothetical protein